WQCNRNKIIMRRVFYILIILITNHVANCQDAHLSQYYAAPLYLNPGMTGMIDQDYRISMNYRSQWRSVTVPYVTTAISYDMRSRKKFGIGGMFLHNSAGDGNFNVINGLISGSYQFTLDTNKNHRVSIGIQGGIIHKSIDWYQLLFGNQYDRGNGGGINSSLDPGIALLTSNVTVPDLNFGAMYYFAKLNSMLNPFLGGSVYHITRPNESFFEEDIKIPRKYNAHVGMKINVSPMFQLSPLVSYMRQEKFNDVAVNVISDYYLKDSDAYLILGSTYRTTRHIDAIILHTGLRKGKFIYRLSYDVNASILTSLSSGRGGIEFSVQYLGFLMPRIPKFSCPRLQ
ncbi:MAG: hypothetical protein FD136_1901, partial [Chitinophagaceae bacterium]